MGMVRILMRVGVLCMPACGTKIDLLVKHKSCFVNATVLATVTVTLSNKTK